MATSTTKQPRIEDDDEEQHGQLVDCFCGRLVDCDERRGVAASGEVTKRVSRLAVEGLGGACDDKSAGGGSVVVVRPSSGGREEDAARVSAGVVGGRTLPPPHAWLAIEDADRKRHDDDHSVPAEEQWTRLLHGGGGGQQQRRSSFSVVRRERAAREAWLDRAWEMKRSWHERNGGAPDADTPVVVVVGTKAHALEEAGRESSSSSPGPPPPSSHQQHGVAMDVEEVRACRDLGLELPSDCTVEVQCYGLSGDSSPTHGSASISSAGADPTDVKARLKAWAQAVALTSTTQLGPS